MPRFQLLVRELGKEPRVVPLAETIIVGRSRSVDLTVDDEEVGRKQFRIGVQSSFVVLEGLGATNPTRIGNGTLQAGERTTVDIGTIIRVGKTEFEVEMVDEGQSGSQAPAHDRTVTAPPPDAPMNTMVDPGPGPRPGPAPGRLPGAPKSSAPGSPPASEGPMNTMEFARPGGPGAGGPGAGGPGAGGPGASGPGTAGPAGGNAKDKSDADRTMPPPGGPGGAGAAPRPAPRPAPPAGPGPGPGPDIGNTMPLPPGGPRPAAPKPGAGGGGPASRKPATEALPPGGAAPGAAGRPPARPPKPETRNEPTPTPPRSPQPPKQQAEPARPKPAAADAPDAANVKKRPSTVAVPIVTPSSMPLGDDPESRMHQAQPLLFVKGDGLKQRLRLMKTVTRIGRAESADMLLPRESVSEQHAEIHFDGEQWMLHDCGGTNGTVCDGNHLRSSSQRIQRNSLIGIGTLQLIFLVTDPATASLDKRTELRALQLLTRFGRLERWEANEIKNRARDDSQSIAEIVLRETNLAPNDWASAVTTARSKPSFFDWLRSLFSGKPK